jgi:hypothetical protein
MRLFKKGKAPMGLSRGVGLIREARRHLTTQVRRIDTQLMIREIGFPLLASIGLIVVAIAIAFEKTDAIYGLVGVIAALLVSACWNAWLLLIEE